MRRFSLFLAVCLALAAAPQQALAQRNVTVWRRALQKGVAAPLSVRGALQQLPAWSFLNTRALNGRAEVKSPVPPLRSAPLQRSALRAALQQRIEQKLDVFPAKKHVDAVIFDLDGTLLNSLDAWDNSAVNFLRSRGIEPPAGLQEKLVKMSLLDGARYIKEMYGFAEPAEELLRQTLAPIRAHYFQDILPRPGVESLVRFLRAQGIKLCVATASDRELAEAALKRLGLFNSFDFIITCDDVGVGKRSPAVYEAALARLGTSKARTLVVEDALYALQTAKKAGFVTAAVAEHHARKDQPTMLREADYYLTSFLNIRFK